MLVTDIGDNILGDSDVDDIFWMLVASVKG